MFVPLYIRFMTDSDDSILLGHFRTHRAPNSTAYGYSSGPDAFQLRTLQA